MKAALAELGGAAPCGAIALLLANDHILKDAFHNDVTGKLSDLAICFVMPLLVSAALGIVTGWTRAVRLWTGAAVTVLVFAAVEMSDTAGALFRTILGWVGLKGVVLTRDPTDLLALLCVPLALAYGGRVRIPVLRRRLATLGGALALIVGSLALMATSPPPLCSEWSAPVVFQTDGGCGSPGVIVVEADEYRGYLTIANRQALGLPGVGPGGSPNVNGRYTGESCPYTLAAGEWEVTVGYCPSGTPAPPALDADGALEAGAGVNADADADAGGVARCPADYRACKAMLEGDVLWFSCHAGDPAAPSCRSRLTVMP